MTYTHLLNVCTQGIVLLSMSFPRRVLRNNRQPSTVHRMCPSLQENTELLRRNFRVVMYFYCSLLWVRNGRSVPHILRVAIPHGDLSGTGVQIGTSKKCLRSSMQKRTNIWTNWRHLTHAISWILTSPSGLAFLTK
jgi:hypothetical protein